MQVLLNEMDITERYQFQTVLAKDTDGEEQDVCELKSSEIIQAQKGDVMVLSGQGYTTGRQYVNGLNFNDGEYSIFARGVPERGREAKWASFENITLMELLYLAAKDLGLGYQRFGVDDQRYARIIRKKENWPDFLRRILRLESSVLKCVDGKLTAISIPWAQSQKAVRTYNITESTPGCRYYEPFAQYRTCILRGQEIDGKAVDTAVPGGREWEPMDITPGSEKGQARRWAQGELLNKNRMGRCFEMAMSYDPELAAMSRIDLTGMSVTRGEWIAGKVVHDMKKEKTNLLLRPCITSIQ
jgi:hypothetical protein